jgi:hypothetical protein
MGFAVLAAVLQIRAALGMPPPAIFFEKEGEG